MIKPSHYKTPRTRAEAFGEDTRLSGSVDNVGHWIAALCVGALIGLMIGIGVR